MSNPNETPEQYAQMLIDLYFGDVDGARRELINAIQTHKDKVSIDYWYAVTNQLWLKRR